MMGLHKRIFLALGPTLMSCSVSVALPAPKYLSVPHWKDCVQTYQKKTASYVCLPLKKPNQCPHDSWLKLTEEQLIERCHRKQSRAR